MTGNKYNTEFLLGEISNARKRDLFKRIENFYRKIPRTECSQCGICCTDPPVCLFVEFLYAYELFDTFDDERKKMVLRNSLQRYIYSLISKSYYCCFFDSNHNCLIHSRACISCKRWGISSKEQYEKNWELDSDCNSKFQEFYLKNHNIVIPNEVLNSRLPYCDKVKVIKNPYRIQEHDYLEYNKNLYNVEMKCLEHANIDRHNEWSINEYLVYFTFGKQMFDTRIKLITEYQSGNENVVDDFINALDYQKYI